jgi:hypothetical protein
LALSIVSAFGLMTFVSCEDDPGTSSSTIDQSLVYGSWRTTQVTLNGVTVPISMTLTIKSDGTIIQNDTNDGTYTWQGNNQLIVVPIRHHSDTADDLVMTIESVNAGTLVISYNGKMDGLTGSFRFTFAKIASGGSDTAHYAQLLVGNWQATKHIVDGVETEHPMDLYFYSNGSGIVSDNGVTEHNNFTYTLNGNVISVIPTYGNVGTITYTIITLDSTNMVLSGQSMPCYENTTYVGYYTRI